MRWISLSIALFLAGIGVLSQTDARQMSTGATVGRKIVSGPTATFIDKAQDVAASNTSNFTVANIPAGMVVVVVTSPSELVVTSLTVNTTGLTAIDATPLVGDGIYAGIYAGVVGAGTAVTLVTTNGSGNARQIYVYSLTGLASNTAQTHNHFKNSSSAGAGVSPTVAIGDLLFAATATVAGNFNSSTETPTLALTQTIGTSNSLSAGWKIASTTGAFNIVYSFSDIVYVSYR